MNSTDQKEYTPEEIKNILAHATGSGQYYRHNGILIYTEGVKDMADMCGAYWLIDIVASCQTLDVFKAEEFQVYKLEVDRPTSTGKVTVTDGNENVLYRQEIPYTDFPLEEISLWLNNPNPVYNDNKFRPATLYLPSEH